MLTIHAIPALTDNYIWLIESVETSKVLIIDPGEAEPVINAVTQNNLTPIAILNTHYHHDHVDGIAELVEHYKTPVYGPENAFIPKLTHPLNLHENLTIAPDFPSFRVLSIPGHTAIHIAYLVDNMLFCGDTLFSAGCGKLLGGTAEHLFNSLQQIIKLAPTTKVYCSHEYTLANLRFAQAVEPNNQAVQQRNNDVKKLRQSNQPSLPTTIEAELTFNPFLRCEQDSVIQAAQQFAGQALNSPLAVFTALRTWKDRF